MTFSLLSNGFSCIVRESLPPTCTHLKELNGIISQISIMTVGITMLWWLRLGENSCIQGITFWLLSLDAVVAPPPFDRTMRDLDMQMNASHHLAGDPIIFLSRNYF